MWPPCGLNVGVYSIIVTLISHRFHIEAVAPFCRATEAHDWKLMSLWDGAQTQILVFTQWVSYLATHSNVLFHIT